LPDATYRNWNAYSSRVSIAPAIDAAESFSFLPDPQTNGGLLVAVKPNSLLAFETIAKESNIQLFELGQFLEFATAEIHLV
jgi:selenide,water dikinase